jgi:two-component system cell cycle sensor histidine kinase/response regulator CckA
VRLAPILFCLLDRQGRITRASGNAPRILGWTGPELAGRDLADLTHPEDREQLGLALENVGTRGETVVFAARLHDRDDQWRPFSWRITAWDAEIYAAAWPADSEDENDHGHLFETALTATTRAVVIADRQGVIEWVNSAFTELTGYSAEDVIGRTPALLKSGVHPEEFYREMWDTITKGRNWTGQFVNKRKDGCHYDERASITPVRNAHGDITHFIGFKEDITEQLRQEKFSLRSQRVESLGLLAGGVAHDLNNVLAPILMAIDVLAEENDPAERADLVETLRRNCERGRDIVRQVLTFARGLEGDHVAIQARHLVKDIAKIAGEVFPKNIVVNNKTPSKLWPVKGDPTQLHQVLLNLCLNARDAMPNGGAITITGANETLPESKTFLDQTIPAGHYIHISVADTGCGMSRESLARAFEPWYTTKEQDKGTGLGLPTSMSIIRGHHGLLTAESSPGRGAIFHFWLPAIRDVVAAPPPRSARKRRPEAARPSSWSMTNPPSSWCSLACSSGAATAC